MRRWAPFCIVLYLLLICVALPVFGTNHSSPTVDLVPDPSDPEPSTSDSDFFRVLDRESGKVYTFTEKEFVLFTVAAELYPQFDEETIKAQAVATYTYYSVLRNKRRANPPADLYGADFENVPSTFPHSYSLEGLQQRWGDEYETYLKKFQSAVDSVYQQKLLYNGNLAHTVYHAISFGVTEDASVLWGGSYPYLTSVDSYGDTLAKGYLSRVTFSSTELTKALQQQEPSFQADKTTVQWIKENLVCSDAGTVLSVNICGTSFTGGEIRRALGLRSACFTVEQVGDQFTFTVKGYGHSVGLSQCGAEYLAKQGADYQSILAHYYPGTVLTKT